LIDVYYRVESRPDGENGQGPRGATAIGPPVDANDLLADVFGDELPSVMAEETTQTPFGGPARDIPALFADAVLEKWMSEIYRLADTPKQFGYFQLSESTMSGLAAELIEGAQRLGLRDRIAGQVRDVVSFRLKGDAAMARPALVAAESINRYINYLGFDALPLQERPMAGQGEARRPVFQPRRQVDDIPPLPARPQPFDRLQSVDWMAALVRLVEDNAMNQDGRTIDVAENARLGQLLETLQGRA
jgi:hypothetical protein